MLSCKPYAASWFCRAALLIVVGGPLFGLAAEVEEPSAEPSSESLRPKTALPLLDTVPRSVNLPSLAGVGVEAPDSNVTEEEGSADEEANTQAPEPAKEPSDESDQPFDLDSLLIESRDPLSDLVMPDTDRPVSIALPRARNIDLTEPVTGHFQAEVEVMTGEPEAVSTEQGELLILLGAQVEPGTSTRLSWSPEETFEGIAVPTPVLVVNGVKPGPVLCLTGAVHGDEINGIEVIRRIMYDLNPADIGGAVIGVPIVNQLGFRRNSRYLPDRRDLNRYFPGTPDGSSAARIAYSFFQEVVVHCDMLVDIHTGSFHRTNLPQLRADLKNPAVAEFTRAFGDMVVLHGEGQMGTLRREAVDIGIPAVTLEAGEPMRIQEDAVADGVKGIRTLMTSLGMSSRPFFWSQPRPAYYRSYWVRASRGGVLMSSVDLGARVSENQVLGVVVNPITNQKSEVVSPFNGTIIGMALDQVVMPGFAAYHVGIQASEEEMRALNGDAAGEFDEGDHYEGSDYDETE